MFRTWPTIWRKKASAPTRSPPVRLISKSTSGTTANGKAPKSSKWRWVAIHWAAWVRRKKWRTLWPFSPALRPALLPAPTWWWMAASPNGCNAKTGAPPPSYGVLRIGPLAWLLSQAVHAIVAKRRDVDCRRPIFHGAKRFAVAKLAPARRRRHPEGSL